MAVIRLRTTHSSQIISLQFASTERHPVAEGRRKCKSLILDRRNQSPKPPLQSPELFPGSRSSGNVAIKCSLPFGNAAQLAPLFQSAAARNATFLSGTLLLAIEQQSVAMNPSPSSTGKFVSQKVSRIRWRPSHTESGQICGTVFATGSWDDEDNAVNVWCWPKPLEDRPSSNGHSDTDSKAADPFRLATIGHEFGDVTDLEFFSLDLLATAASDGSVTLIKVQSPPEPPFFGRDEEWKLLQACRWERLHNPSRTGQTTMGCNGVTALANHLVSVGQDGQICLLNPNAKPSSQIVRAIPKADSCSLTGVTPINKEGEVATINSRGQLKVWDLRQSRDEPTMICVLSSDQIGLSCLARHPVQAHVVCTGDSDGVLAFWDLRKETHPVTLIRGHSQAVSEVQFHPQQPDHLFSCSQSGDIFHWNAGSLLRSTPALIGLEGHSNGWSNPTGTGCVWLNSDAVKHRVETRGLMNRQPLPINSLDAMGSSVLVAGDNEAIYRIENAIPY